jgi:hypothetical protein
MWWHSTRNLHYRKTNPLFFIPSFFFVWRVSKIPNVVIYIFTYLINIFVFFHLHSQQKRKRKQSYYISFYYHSMHRTLVREKMKIRTKTTTTTKRKIFIHWIKLIGTVLFTANTITSSVCFMNKHTICFGNKIKRNYYFFFNWIFLIFIWDNNKITHCNCKPFVRFIIILIYWC